MGFHDRGATERNAEQHEQAHEVPTTPAAPSAVLVVDHLDLRGLGSPVALAEAARSALLIRPSRSTERRERPSAAPRQQRKNRDRHRRLASLGVSALEFAEHRVSVLAEPGCAKARRGRCAVKFGWRREHRHGPVVVRHLNQTARRVKLFVTYEVVNSVDRRPEELRFGREDLCPRFECLRCENRVKLGDELAPDARSGLAVLRSAGRRAIRDDRRRARAAASDGRPRARQSRTVDRRPRCSC